MEAAGSFPATRPQGDALNRDLVTENFVCFFFPLKNIFQVLGYLVTKK